MKVLQSADSIFCKVADNQPAFTGKGRWMKYVIRQNVEEGILLFNTLTCEHILLDEEEYNSSLSTPDSSLADRWFIVPEEFDEKMFVNQIRPILKAVKHERGVNSYTILTTTDCNARCFYCYEKGRSRIPMSAETAKKVSSYIISNYQHQTPYVQHPSKVHIGWFGGEPLYNQKVIDSICSDLKDAEVPYTSTMISNGYLFTLEVVERAKTLWNLKSVQITLDGTEEVYNKAKSYYRISDNAYKRVLGNIQLLLDAEIRVNIRMNLDLHNAGNLALLTDELQSTFGKNKYLTAYSHTLFDCNDHVSTSDERPMVNALNDKLMDRLLESGMRNTGELPNQMIFNYCMADGGQAVIVAPTGDLGKCEHFTDSDFFSHIDSPEKKDEAMIRKFAERMEDIPLCDDCPYYPQCIRLKACFEGNKCDEYIRSQHIKEIQEKMVMAYSRKEKTEADKKENDSADANAGLTGYISYQVFPLLDCYVAIGTDDTGKEGRVIRLNETGREIFEMHIAGKTLDEIVATMLEEYDATEQELTEVVKDFMDEITSMVR